MKSKFSPTKLSKEQKEEIKKLLSDERGIKQTWIAEKFGVQQTAIAYYKRKLKKVA